VSKEDEMRKLMARRFAHRRRGPRKRVKDRDGNLVESPSARDGRGLGGERGTSTTLAVITRALAGRSTRRSGSTRSLPRPW
jgi:hypothetical protein